jgi:hypothetical protein
MFHVTLQGVGVDYDVVKVHIHPIADEFIEEVIHQNLICCRCVTVTLLQHGTYHVPIRCGDCCAFHMFGDYLDLFIGILPINY